MPSQIKQKPRPSAAIFASNARELSALYHGSDALRTQNLMHLATILHDEHLLEVGPESPVGRPQGEAPVMTKNCRLTAFFTLSHVQDPFLP
jgi:hypothetical protein